MIAMFKLLTLLQHVRGQSALCCHINVCMYVCSLLNGDTTSMFDIIKGSFTNTKSNRLFNLVGAGVHCVKPLNTEKSYNSFWHGSVGHCFICQSTPGQLKSPRMILGPARLIIILHAAGKLRHYVDRRRTGPQGARCRRPIHYKDTVRHVEI